MTRGSKPRIVEADGKDDDKLREQKDKISMRETVGRRTVSHPSTESASSLPSWSVRNRILLIRVHTWLPKITDAQGEQLLAWCPFDPESLKQFLLDGNGDPVEFIERTPTFSPWALRGLGIIPSSSAVHFSGEAHEIVDEETGWVYDKTIDDSSNSGEYETSLPPDFVYQTVHKAEIIRIRRRQGIFVTVETISGGKKRIAQRFIVPAGPESTNGTEFTEPSYQTLENGTKKLDPGSDTAHGANRGNQSQPGSVSENINGHAAAKSTIEGNLKGNGVRGAKSTLPHSSLYPSYQNFPGTVADKRGRARVERRSSLDERVQYQRPNQRPNIAIPPPHSPSPSYPPSNESQQQISSKQYLTPPKDHNGFPQVFGQDDSIQKVAENSLVPSAPARSFVSPESPGRDVNRPDQWKIDSQQKEATPTPDANLSNGKSSGAVPDALPSLTEYVKDLKERLSSQGQPASEAMVKISTLDLAKSSTANYSVSEAMQQTPSNPSDMYCSGNLDTSADTSMSLGNPFDPSSNTTLLKVPRGIPVAQDVAPQSPSTLPQGVARQQQPSQETQVNKPSVQIVVQKLFSRVPPPKPHPNFVHHCPGRRAVRPSHNFSKDELAYRSHGWIPVADVIPAPETRQYRYDVHSRMIFFMSTEKHNSLKSTGPIGGEDYTWFAYKDEKGQNGVGGRVWYPMKRLLNHLMNAKGKIQKLEYYIDPSWPFPTPSGQVTSAKQVQKEEILQSIEVSPGVPNNEIHSTRGRLLQEGNGQASSSGSPTVSRNTPAVVSKEGQPNGIATKYLKAPPQWVGDERNIDESILQFTFEMRKKACDQILSSLRRCIAPNDASGFNLVAATAPQLINMALSLHQGGLPLPNESLDWTIPHQESENTVVDQRDKVPRVLERIRILIDLLGRHPAICQDMLRRKEWMPVFIVAPYSYAKRKKQVFELQKQMEQERAQQTAQGAHLIQNNRPQSSASSVGAASLGSQSAQNQHPHTPSTVPRAPSRKRDVGTPHETSGDSSTHKKARHGPAPQAPMLQASPKNQQYGNRSVQHQAAYNSPHVSQRSANIPTADQQRILQMQEERRLQQQQNQIYGYQQFQQQQQRHYFQHSSQMQQRNFQQPGTPQPQLQQNMQHPGFPMVLFHTTPRQGFLDPNMHQQLYQMAPASQHYFRPNVDFAQHGQGADMGVGQGVGLGLSMVPNFPTQSPQDHMSIQNNGGFGELVANPDMQQMTQQGTLDNNNMDINTTNNTYCNGNIMG